MDESLQQESLSLRWRKNMCQGLEAKARGEGLDAEEIPLIPTSNAVLLLYTINY
jgi:hypothetical protein